MVKDATTFELEFCGHTQATARARVQRVQPTLCVIEF